MTTFNNNQPNDLLVYKTSLQAVPETATVRVTNIITDETQALAYTLTNLCKAYHFQFEAQEFEGGDFIIQLVDNESVLYSEKLKVKHVL